MSGEPTNPIDPSEIDALLDACDRLRYHHVSLDMPNHHARVREEGMRNQGGQYPYGSMVALHEGAEREMMNRVHRWYKEHFANTSLSNDKRLLKEYLARQAARIGKAAIEKRKALLDGIEDGYKSAEGEAGLAHALAVMLAYRSPLPVVLTAEMADELYARHSPIPPNCLLPSPSPNTASEIKQIVKEGMHVRGDVPANLRGRRRYATEWDRNTWLKWREKHVNNYPFEDKFYALSEFGQPGDAEAARQWFYRGHPFLVLFVANPPPPYFLADILRLAPGAKYEGRTRGDLLSGLVKGALAPMRRLNMDLTSRLSEEKEMDIDFENLEPVLRTAAIPLVDDQDDALQVALRICYRELDRANWTDVADYILMGLGLVLLVVFILPIGAMGSFLVALAGLGVDLAIAANAVAKYQANRHALGDKALDEIFAELSGTIRLVEAREFTDLEMLGLFVELLSPVPAAFGVSHAMRAMRAEAEMVTNILPHRPPSKQVLPELPDDVDRTLQASKSSVPNEAKSVASGAAVEGVPDPVGGVRATDPNYRMLTDQGASSQQSISAANYMKARRNEPPMSVKEVNRRLEELSELETISAARRKALREGLDPDEAEAIARQRLRERETADRFESASEQTEGARNQRPPERQQGKEYSALEALRDVNAERAQRARARKIEENRRLAEHEAKYGANGPKPVKEKVVDPDAVAFEEVYQAYRQRETAEASARATGQPPAVQETVPPPPPPIRSASELNTPSSITQAADAARLPVRVGATNVAAQETAVEIQARATRIVTAREQAETALDALDAPTIEVPPGRSYAQARELNDAIIQQNANRVPFVLHGRITRLDGLPPDLVDLIQRGAAFRVSRAGNLLYRLPGEADHFTHVFDVLRSTRNRRALYGYTNANRTSAWYQDLRVYWEARGLARQTDLGWEFYDLEMRVWIPENHMDMGHIVSAVEHNQLMMRRAENLRGQLNDAEIQARIQRSVRAFMNDFTNYLPQYRWRNQRLGAPSDLTYGIVNQDHVWGSPGRVRTGNTEHPIAPPDATELPERFVDEALDVYEEALRSGDIRVSQ